MKFGAKPPKIWHDSNEIKGGFSKLNSQINRLLLLESIWQKSLGDKSKFWLLDAVKGSTVYVKVPVVAARHQLILQERQLVNNLNKYFDKAWIKNIRVS